MKELKMYIAVRENNREYGLLGIAEKRELLIELIENDIKKYINNLYGRNNVEVLNSKELYILLDRDNNKTLCSWKIYPIKHIVE